MERPKQPEAPHLLKVREVADRLRVSTRCVRDMIKSGALAATRFTERTTRVPATEVERLLRSRVTPSRPADPEPC